MTAQRIGLLTGAIALLLGIFAPTPDGLSREGLIVAGLVVLMASWWMTEALPLTATALMPFLVLPFAGISNARETASTYYSPILFLLLGGAFIALAIERTGLHKRLSLAILRTIGTSGGQSRLLLAFMISAALLSMMISNTSTSLIMMPMALAVLAGGGIAAEDRDGLAGALPMGIAFAASIGGLGTLVGSPTNAIAVGLLDETIGMEITFAEWTLYGLPVVIVGVPLAAWIISYFQKVDDHPFDVASARNAIEVGTGWSTAERRLVPVVALTFVLWMTLPIVRDYLPAGSWTNGTIAIAASLALFLLPDGTGRPLLVWKEADRAPWGVIMMFGGGLALAAGMTKSGLAEWLGQALLPLSAVPLLVVALALVAMVILITEFASNVATATGIIPIIGSLVVALGADPILLAMPAALAASWGFMLPAGTGPNAIAWSTGHIKIGNMVKAGFVLDLIGIGLIVGLVWAVAALV
ncbi:SLC13 family permease [Parerythrobacter jejuensis]|uniref:DASS family sodium-coupled anion symporter n=1 Tax=Parerythrobacter jejuensis TaxID=795812 RepID=A0A845AU46_9SPHN|nr:DASS family sodium-coupled anion symporter [Parerythrobacter jejuensis]MXP30269.1 DASS family sodium-coupled anion symporter [Parerythrobacter jejuensis]MXP33029.1 DASS family sodium-coupled anion symporter [Parerythrobacter jejuensis]